MQFEWDPEKDFENQRKHGVSFTDAQEAFYDPNRVITEDLEHSTEQEARYFCFGKAEHRILTVRFTFRNDKIRIFGAGFWRQGRKRYETENKIH